MNSHKKLVSKTLKYFEDMLREKGFARIHKSYIINTSKIDKISGNQVYLIDKTIIPIGRTYKDDFLNRYVKWGWFIDENLFDAIVFQWFRQ